MRHDEAYFHSFTVSSMSEKLLIRPHEDSTPFWLSLSNIPDELTFRQANGFKLLRAGNKCPSY